MMPNIYAMTQSGF